MLHGFFGSVPCKLGYRLADFATPLHWLGFPARRHAVLTNLAILLPGASRCDRARVAWRMMRSYNHMMYEFFRLPRIPLDELIGSVEIVGEDHLARALGRGRGAIITSAHIGNWELAAVMLAQMGYRLNAIAGKALTRWLSGAVRDARARLRLATIPPRNCFGTAIGALKRNEIVALLVDGHLFARGVTVEWFGRATPFPPGAGLLAQRTGALVVPSYCERIGPGRFRLIIEPPLDPGSYFTAAELHQAIASSAERYIRSHLDQWCIFRPLRTTPALEESLAPAGEDARGVA